MQEVVQEPLEARQGVGRAKVLCRGRVPNAALLCNDATTYLILEDRT
jgi:hypothetical protein